MYSGLRVNAHRQIANSAQMQLFQLATGLQLGGVHCISIVYSNILA